MKYLVALLVSPILVIFNLIGGVYALCAVGFMNGYIKVMQAMSDAQEEKRWDK